MMALPFVRLCRLTLCACVLFAVLVFGVAAKAQFPGGVETPFFAWRPDGQMLAIANGTSVQIQDGNTGAILYQFVGLEPQVTAPAWSPDGTKLAIGNGADLEIWQEPWNGTTAQLVLDYGYYRDLNPPETVDTATPLWAIVWKENGQQIAISVGVALYVIELQTAARVNRIYHEWSIVQSFGWQNGLFLVPGGARISAYLVDENNSILTAFSPTDFMQLEGLNGIYTVELNPDGMRLAVATSDGWVAVWDDIYNAGARSEQPSIVFHGNGRSHDNGVISLAWSEDGQYLASAGMDSMVKVWSTITGDLLQTIDLSSYGEYVHINTVAWRPGTEMLIYGMPDGTIAVFDGSQLPDYLQATAIPSLRQ
jgi:WD40 repeat protein